MRIWWTISGLIVLVLAIWLVASPGESPAPAADGPGEPASTRAAPAAQANLPEAPASSGAGTEAASGGRRALGASDPGTSSLHVVVRRAGDAAPLTGIGVEAVRRGTDSVFAALRARTDDRGSARFDAIPAGRWDVALDRGPSQTVDVEAGETAELAFELEQGFDADVQVLFANGHPAPGAEVWVWPPSQLGRGSRSHVYLSPGRNSRDTPNERERRGGEKPRFDRAGGLRQIDACSAARAAV